MSKGPDLRIAALRRFAIAITIINLLGHTVLGFEPSWAQLVVSVGTAYLMELALEGVDARANRRRPAFAGGWAAFVEFLLPAHITGLAIAMLMFANGRLLPFAFAAAVAITSKSVFVAPVGRGWRHFLNPSNTGIAVTLLLFHWVAIAPPYQFTEGLRGALDWALPALIVCTGTFLNGRFTRRLPLIAGWVAGFAAQAVVRSWVHGTPLVAALAPMTGVAFVLFTFYMAPDPGTTPTLPRSQVVFGVSVAAAYGVLVSLHVVFGLFFALLVVCSARGILLHLLPVFQRARAGAAAASPQPAPVPGGTVAGAQVV